MVPTTYVTTSSTLTTTTVEWGLCFGPCHDGTGCPTRRKDRVLISYAQTVTLKPLLREKPAPLAYPNQLATPRSIRPGFRKGR